VYSYCAFGVNGQCICGESYGSTTNCSACFLGFDLITNCQTCRSGFYGTNCTQCPNCKNNTFCNDSMSGNGQCICHYGFNQNTNCGTCISGFDITKNCSDCLANFYGADCSNYCNTFCNNGYCSTGINGTGKCICNDNYDTTSNCTELYTSSKPLAEQHDDKQPIIIGSVVGGVVVIVAAASSVYLIYFTPSCLSLCVVRTKRRFSKNLSVAQFNTIPEIKPTSIKITEKSGL